MLKARVQSGHIQLLRGADPIKENEPKAIAPRSKGRLHKTCKAEMEVAGCSIFARRLIDTVLRNNSWQFKNVRFSRGSRDIDKIQIEWFIDV